MNNDTRPYQSVNDILWTCVHLWMTTVLVLPAASLYRSDDNEELRNEYHLYHMHHVGGNPEGRTYIMQKDVSDTRLLYEVQYSSTSCP